MILFQEHEGQLYQAIVLRSLSPLKQKVMLLDSTLGRVEGTIAPASALERLSSGMMISYAIEKWKSSYLFAQIDIIDEPAYYMQTDIHFLHHILELCSYFLPLHDSVPSVYQLVALLYDKQILLESSLEKKLFICKFFSLLGIYPDNAKSYDASFLHLISKGLISSDLISGDISSDFEAKKQAMHQKIRAWLLSCLATHPQMDKLKTAYYLYNLN